MKALYRVTTDGDCEGKTTRLLGYAIGEKVDIEAFYFDKKYYSLYLEKIDTVEVTRELVDKKALLIKKKQSLEAELSAIEKQLK